MNNQLLQWQNRQENVADMDYEDFIESNKGVGMLKVHVYAGNQAVPLENVTILIEKSFRGYNHLFLSETTNSSGMIDGISLPAPEGAGEARGGQMYRILIQVPMGYLPEKARLVPIVAGEKSILQVQLMPNLGGKK